ncbi:four helix bundle protein [Desulfurispirillum indicum]|nr:four helix bundle protein [Desulfurispirillum indicum]UCZ56538.1 four helix bundle protein [Desulfurispirillum indicum]
MFPKEEIYGLSAQMRRSAVSVPSNIAEGNARSGTKEYIQFLYIARGSLQELETQLIIANEIGYMAQSVTEELLAEILMIKKMLNSLISALRNKI